MTLFSDSIGWSYARVAPEIASGYTKKVATSASLPASCDLSAGIVHPIPSRTHPAPATRLLPWLRGKPVSGHGLPLYHLPRHEPQAVAYHVYYAQLDLHLRVDGINRFGKPFRPSTQAIRISFRPRFFSSVSTFSQNFAPSFRQPAYLAALSDHQG